MSDPDWREVARVHVVTCADGRRRWDQAEGPQGVRRIRCGCGAVFTPPDYCDAEREAHSIADAIGERLYASLWEGA